MIFHFWVAGPSAGPRRGPLWWCPPPRGFGGAFALPAAPPLFGLASPIEPNPAALCTQKTFTNTARQYAEGKDGSGDDTIKEDRKQKKI